VRLGRYHLITELGRGGMAQVFLARREGTAEPCVLKLLLMELSGHELAFKRFQREAHLASILDHPHIARVLDAGAEGDRFCIATEFIAGKDIGAIIRELGGPMPLDVCVSVAMAVLDALAYAHDARNPDGDALQLVHRDLTPRNVMLGHAGEVKVIDFGVAHGNIDAFRTRPGTAVGTPRYMSPEQALALDIDQRSDLYSFSAVLFEMLTGRALVSEGAFFDVLIAVARDIAPRASSLNPKIPRGLDEVLAIGLAKDRADRYQTAAEYQAALQAAAGPLAAYRPAAITELLGRLFPADAQRIRELLDSDAFTGSGGNGEVAAITRPEHRALSGTPPEAAPTMVATSPGLLESGETRIATRIDPTVVRGSQSVADAHPRLLDPSSDAHSTVRTDVGASSGDRLVISRFCPVCDLPVEAPYCPVHGICTFGGTAGTAGDSIHLGSVIAGRYRLDRLLASGGMGSVYLATQLGVGRAVAVKVLRPDLVSDLPIVKRFYREAHAVSQLNHPNIVRIVDFGIDPSSNSPFLALELVRGQTLREFMEQNGPVGERPAAELMVQVAKALVEAHQKGVVHRDLKPENLMVEVLPDGDSHLRVLDFGLSKVIGASTGGRLTATGAVVGTPLYMSPEQSTGGEIDFRSDLYSLGCILYELIAGRAPFNGSSALEVMSKHASAAPPSLPVKLADGRPPSSDLRSLLQILLKKEPANRPANTAAVSRALSQMLRGEHTLPLEPRPPSVLNSAVAQSLTIMPPRPVKRVGAIVASAVALVAATVVLTLQLAENRNRPAPPPPPVVRAPAVDVAEAPKASPPRRPAVRIESTPAGAEVYLEGSYRGQTPFDLVLEPGAELRFVKLGYQDARSVYDGTSLNPPPTLVRIPPPRPEFPVTKAPPPDKKKKKEEVEAWK
jgi:serine/threonine-protein kinase